MWTKCLSLFANALFLRTVLPPSPGPACQADELQRDQVFDLLKRQILEGLGIDEPPLAVQQFSHMMERTVNHVLPRRTRETREKRKHNQESWQFILFPSSESTRIDMLDRCSNTASGTFTYYFQPSMDSQNSIITSAHFWFYAGEAVASNNVSAPLFILNFFQELFQASEAPLTRSPDGWTTYKLDHHVLIAMTDGPFMLQIRCPACSCYCSQEDKTPFLHLHVQPSSPVRSRRALKMSWSPDAVEILRRPATVDVTTDCRREQIEISFGDLGWDNWIVHPKAFTFYYCNGNCSSSERTTTLLGIKQCCAPVPESMKSLRFTTTSDGGYSFKCETLPNIIPEECNCI